MLPGSNINPFFCFDLYSYTQFAMAHSYKNNNYYRGNMIDGVLELALGSNTIHVFTLSDNTQHIYVTI